MNILTYSHITYSSLTGKLNKYMINNIQEYLLPLYNNKYDLNKKILEKTMYIYQGLNNFKIYNEIINSKIHGNWTIIVKASS